MSKQTNPAKKIIKTETKKPEVFSGPSTPIAARRKTTTSLTNTPVEFTFNKDNIRWLLISVGLVILGYALMMGGRMPSNEVWDEKLIYSFRRTVISPIVILGGLVLAIYAIFRNKPDTKPSAES
ncbi:MAG TPA: DUF3098 domain-containing protein [Saprospiraceae bacterium]|nr:DUF3098 domain-containing protein [Saprospiraceae bacterium]HNT22173.1 DUF3098 domain-containing protein [Saprospiraceae bacterium]